MSFKKGLRTQDAGSTIYVAKCGFLQAYVETCDFGDWVDVGSSSTTQQKYTFYSKVETSEQTI